jgi:hypothetical protein
MSGTQRLPGGQPRKASQRHSRRAAPLHGAMEQRMAALGFGWADVTATQVYTIFDLHPLLANEFVRRGAIPGGLIWHRASACAGPRFRG